MRIVSLLPSATEILFAVGAGDHVAGVTFECDFPEEARGRTIVSTTALTPGMTPAEIDATVRAQLPPVRTCTPWTRAPYGPSTPIWW